MSWTCNLQLLKFQFHTLKFHNKELREFFAKQHHFANNFFS